MNDATTAESDRGVWSDPRAADLYTSHVDVLHAYVARRVGRDLAADVVAEAFRIAIEDLDRYDAARGSQRAWLFGIATNLLRRHWRTETRRLTAMSRYGATRVPAGDPLLRIDDQIDADADVGRLWAAMAELDIEDRDLLVLIAWEGCSYRETARALGIPVGTVRSRLHRIRRTLRTAIRRSTLTDTNERLLDDE
jgi:RNA polymerase sigma-70 factor (ECF subfamily)